MMLMKRTGMNSMLVIFIQSADLGCDDIKNNIESNLKANDIHVERLTRLYRREDSENTFCAILLKTVIQKD